MTTAHNWARKPYKLDVYEGGSLVELHGLSGVAPNVWGKRGDVEGYTWESRRRMLQKLASIDRRAMQLGLFVTLTYPAVFSWDPAVWKLHLRRFFYRLKRLAPTAVMIWKLEPQKRGAPHFHLIVFNAGDATKQFKRWVARAWYECVRSGDVKHLRHGTKTQRFKSWRGVMAYGAKYIGKTFEHVPVEWRRVGRWWGVEGRRHLVQTLRTISLPVEQADRLRTALRELKGKARQDKGRKVDWRAGDPASGVSAFVDVDELRNLLVSCGIRVFY